MKTPTALSAADLLDRDFLSLRHRVLDIAAGLDRLDRGRNPEEIASDPRINQLREALAVLSDSRADRAERVQLICSDPNDDGWRSA